MLFGHRFRQSIAKKLIFCLGSVVIIEAVMTIAETPKISATGIARAEQAQSGIDPARLFTIPTATVLRSRDINLTGGSAFGGSSNQSFLGVIAVGLGNIAEVEFSSTKLVNNIAQGSPITPTSAFKLQLIPSHLFGWSWFPTAAVAIRSTAEWSHIRSDQTKIAANQSWMDRGIYNIGYQTRFSVLYLISSIQLGFLGLHGGMNLMDIRTKDTRVWYLSSCFHEPVEIQHEINGLMAGFDVRYNPQTKLMFEISHQPQFVFSDSTNRVRVNRDFLAVAGIRYFFTPWLSIDTGIWYQGHFLGIADSEIKIGINLFLPGHKIDNLPGSLLKLKTRMRKNENTD